MSLKTEIRNWERKQGVIKILDLSAIVFFLNIPFGSWRANAGKFSCSWVAAIHLPGPLVIFLCFMMGIGWALVSFPALVGAYLNNERCLRARTQR